jgi:acyl-CoA reductase-like NAD-dependent aldehyde dehydrogenase
MDRLAALEAEVKADADAQRARKDAAVAKLRDQRVTQTAEREQLRARQAALVGRKRTPLEELSRSTSGRAERTRTRDDDSDHLEDLGGALELASKANRVKKELQAPRKKGEKSWAASGVVSLMGPIGWLYAGSWREAVPATAAWVGFLALASKFLPALLMWPVFMVVMPVSAIAGVVYALQYNRSGKRQRLFGGDKAKAKQKQLRG